jgi:methionine synthase I (cobalamin-dependent)
MLMDTPTTHVTAYIFNAGLPKEAETRCMYIQQNSWTEEYINQFVFHQHTKACIH